MRGVHHHHHHHHQQQQQHMIAILARSSHGNSRCMHHDHMFLCLFQEHRQCVDVIYLERAAVCNNMQHGLLHVVLVFLLEEIYVTAMKNI